MREQALAGACQGIVVQALSQTGGKGRQGREWSSPPGNLYVSLLLPRGQRPVTETAFVAALAVYETAAPHAEGLMLKWPNDVLQDGRKLAGILIENMDERGIIVGVGLNLHSPPAGAAGLKGLDISQARDTLLLLMDHYYALWQEEGFETIRALWLERAHKPGTVITAAGFSGVFENIDHDGALLLRDNQNKLHRLTAGDVNLVSGQ